MPLTRSLRGCRQRRKELDREGEGACRRCCWRGVQKVAKLRATVLGLLGNSCGNELEKSAPHATPNQFPLKAKANQGREGEEEEEEQAASPERFLKITKLLSICRRGRNSNNNNGMSLTTINHGRVSGRVAAWVCLVGVHRRLCQTDCPVPAPATLFYFCFKLRLSNMLMPTALGLKSSLVLGPRPAAKLTSQPNAF